VVRFWVPGSQPGVKILGVFEGAALIVGKDGKLFDMRTLPREEFQLSEEKCLEIGGHCWIDITGNEVYLTNPPQYPPAMRRCKHCGKKEVRRVVHKENWEEFE